jgi:hypothetical protein
MSDAPSPAGPIWLTYQQAAERLGLPTPNAAAARARRGKWPKRIRNDTGEAEIAVPAELLSAAPQKRQERHEPPAPPSDAPTLADAVRAAVTPLQAILERETLDRRTLQSQADALRDQLAAAQLEAAQAVGVANTERAKREAAETRAADLQRQLDELQAKQRRRWWWQR